MFKSNKVLYTQEKNEDDVDKNDDGSGDQGHYTG